MLAFFYYCLKIITCSGILYGYYLLALRNNSFHQWNRWYLLAAVVISFSFPLLRIPLPDFFGSQPQLVYSGEGMVLPAFYVVKKDTGFHFSLPLTIAFIYAGVVLFLLLRLAKNILAIQRLKHTYQEEAVNDIHFYNTAEPGTPFSFFKNIFWNSSIPLHTEKGSQMLRHEMAHVTELHSADKVFLQVLTAFAFWNPFLYLIKKELSIIHEFIADQKASAGDDQVQYASLLLMKAMGSQQYALGNPFFHSQLKRRILMLTTSKNPRFSYLRRVMVLPLAALSLILFSFKYKEIKEKKAAPQIHKTAQMEDDFYSDSSKPKFYVQLNKNYRGSAIEQIVPTTDGSGIVVKTADDKTYFLNRSSARQELDFIITDSGLIAPPGAILVTGANRVVAKNGAYIQTSSQSSFPQYQYTIDTTAAGFSKAVSLHPDINNFSINGNQDMHVEVDLLKVPANPNVDVKGLEGKLIIIDGIKTGLSGLQGIDPSSIKSIDILKGESATNRYGQEGKNGAIIITSKPRNLPSSDLLYILDGVESTKEVVEHILPENIQSVDVLKGEAATSAYGERGKNGVVITKTKNPSPAWLNDKTLIIKDGQESNREDTKRSLDKGIVTSYSEMPPTAAMKVYGERGRNGAVIFTTNLARNEVTFSDAKPPNPVVEKVVIGHRLQTDSTSIKNRPPAPAVQYKAVTGYRIVKDSTAKSGFAALVKQPEDLKEVVIVGFQQKEDYKKVFTKVDQPASFPGGVDGWRRYLERNLQYPVAAQDKGTQGTVRVQMTVNENGNITELKALNDPGNGLAAEAERVIGKGPKWVPAKQNGKPVTYRFVQTLTFQLQ